MTFARMHLVPRLGTFLYRYPQLQLELKMDDRASNLVAESIDISLYRDALTDSTLVIRKLAEADLIVVARPRYLSRRDVPNTPGDLIELNAIHDQSFGCDEWHFHHGSSATSVRIQRRLTISAAEGVRSALLTGKASRSRRIGCVRPSLTQAK
jgi:DNA-binding transcriptional LysR family regulator